MTTLERLRFEHWYEIQDPNYNTPFWVYYLQVVFESWEDRLICKITGHNFIDDDPGDCEVGPQPDIYCTKCGCSPF